MKPFDLVLKLIVKATQDETVLDKILDDENVSDEIIGFHCQQAAEKLLKALLIYLDIPFRRTHDLAELIDLLKDHNFELPEDLSDLDILTPFAVEFRYDLLLESASTLERREARDMVARLHVFVENYCNS